MKLQQKITTENYNRKSKQETRLRLKRRLPIRLHWKWHELKHTKYRFLYIKLI